MLVSTYVVRAKEYLAPLDESYKVGRVMSGAGSGAISRQLAEALSSAKQVVVFAGTGVSAESGIATFRDKLMGPWKPFDPSELAMSKAFNRDPRWSGVGTSGGA